MTDELLPVQILPYPSIRIWMNFSIEKRNWSICNSIKHGAVNIFKYLPIHCQANLGYTRAIFSVRVLQNSYSFVQISKDHERDCGRLNSIKGRRSTKFVTK